MHVHHLHAAQSVRMGHEAIQSVAEPAHGMSGLLSGFRIVRCRVLFCATLCASARTVSQLMDLCADCTAAMRRLLDRARELVHKELPWHTKTRAQSQSSESAAANTNLLSWRRHTWRDDQLARDFDESEQRLLIESRPASRTERRGHACDAPTDRPPQQTAIRFGQWQRLAARITPRD